MLVRITKIAIYVTLTFKSGNGGIGSQLTLSILENIVKMEFFIYSLLPYAYETCQKLPTMEVERLNGIKLVLRPHLSITVKILHNIHDLTRT